jgi:chromosome segregation ATPase
MFGIMRGKKVAAVAERDELGLDLGQTLEDELSAALEEGVEDQAECSAPDSPRGDEPGLLPEPEAADYDLGQLQPHVRQWSHTQANLAALSTFEDEMRGAGSSLEAIGEALASVVAAQQSAIRFVGGVRTGINRANELESSLAAMAAENRRQAQQIEQAKSHQERLEAQEETNRRRLSLLVQDCDTLKIMLSAAQLEANEVREALAEAENERASLINELASKSAAAERVTRENEALRQRHVSQQINHAALEQLHAETERKLEEVASIRRAETAELSELRLKAEDSEKECRRIQKHAEVTEAKLEEAQNRIMALDADVEEIKSRHASTVQRMRSESEAQKARLETASRKQIADAAEIEALRQQLADAVAAQRVLESQLAALSEQLETVRAGDGFRGEINHRVASADADGKKESSSVRDGRTKGKSKPVSRPGLNGSAYAA